MLRSKILDAMKDLQLPGMWAAFDEVMAQGAKRHATAEKMLLELLEAEAAERQVRSIRYRLGQARFPMAKDLDSFEFAASAVDEGRIRALCDGSFLQACSNVIFVGVNGSVKVYQFRELKSVPVLG